ALKAGVNECTIFRKFKEKKEIVLAATKMPKWNPCLSEEDFKYNGDLKEDLISFSKVYMSKVTPEMVKISIGLRSPELEGVAIPSIMEVPNLFKKILINYFNEMISKGKIKNCNVESLALQFISMNFGFVFLDASFKDKLVGISKIEYINNSVELFINGISN
ncbi:MAG: TetR/AcrR family transcriptional regulator, partial [Anaeroplasmataceae bacterium]